MIFANPCGLLWGLTAVLVVVLYLRRVRLRREGVATGMFWERAFAEERLRTAWRKWRRGVSATVQLIALGLIVAALADPQIPGPRRIVLIVDNSAGMRAADVQPTRLAEAKQAAQRLIAGLRPCDRMAILSAGPAVSVRASLTNERRRLNNVLDEVDVSTGRGSSGVPAAAELARRMLARAPGGKIQVVTDGCFRGARELAEADDVELIRVGRPTGNAAVTRLAARRMPTDPTRCQVLVEVRNFSDRPVECLLKIESTTGQSLESVPLKLDRNGRRQTPRTIAACLASAWRRTAQRPAPQPARRESSATPSAATGRNPTGSTTSRTTTAARLPVRPDVAVVQSPNPFQQIHRRW